MYYIYIYERKKHQKMGASKEKDNDFENWQSIKRHKERRMHKIWYGPMH